MNHFRGLHSRIGTVAQFHDGYGHTIGYEMPIIPTLSLRLRNVSSAIVLGHLSLWVDRTRSRRTFCNLSLVLLFTGITFSSMALCGRLFTLYQLPSESRKEEVRQNEAGRAQGRKEGNLFKPSLSPYANAPFSIVHNHVIPSYSYAFSLPVRYPQPTKGLIIGSYQ